jgi:methylated-DNA-protein-cysteine methyltransferase related protein
LDLLHTRIIHILKQLPKGKVATYGQIAALADSPRAARQVVWVLHTHSQKLKLPWFRVINSKGTISLPKNGGFEEQRTRLIRDGVKVTPLGKIDLKLYQWQPAGKRAPKKSATT